MSTSTKKEEPKRKSQKLKVLVSIYRSGDKIISYLGIPTNDAWIVHKLPKDELKADELFNISQAFTNDDPFRKDTSYQPSIANVLDNNVSHIVLPSKRANELKNIGNLVHQILRVEMELFVK